MFFAKRQSYSESEMRRRRIVAVVPPAALLLDVGCGDGFITAGLATVQPWLDIPQLGSAVVVTTDNQPQLAEQLCSEIATELWRRREEYLPELFRSKMRLPRPTPTRRGWWYSATPPTLPPAAPPAQRPTRMVIYRFSSQVSRPGGARG